LRRSNDDIIIGCYSSQQTWQLKCDGREWKGLVGTCPEMCKNNAYKFYLNLESSLGILQLVRCSATSVFLLCLDWQMGYDYSLQLPVLSILFEVWFYSIYLICEHVAHKLVIHQFVVDYVKFTISYFISPHRIVLNMCLTLSDDYTV